MQTSYSNNPPLAAFAGQSADTGPKDLLTGLAVTEPSAFFAPTVTNSVAYTITFTYPDGSTQTATYTSDSTATNDEIIAGLIAAINANTSIVYVTPYQAGDELVVKSDAGAPASGIAVMTSTGVGVLAVSTTESQIPFGIFVALETNSGLLVDGMEQIRQPNQTGDIILGLAASTHYLQTASFPADPAVTPRYPGGSAVNVARTGRYWAKPDTAVTAGGAVYFRHAANGAGKSQLGTPGGSTDSGNATALTGARWLDSASAGEFARLQLNLA